MSMSRCPSLRSASTLALSSVPAFFLLSPFVLATLTWLGLPASLSIDSMGSALYKGRVWHRRFYPTKHSFQYPLFLFCLDLEELEKGLVRSALGCLRFIVSFRPEDHLKGHQRIIDGSLLDKLLAVVREKTNDVFQPTRETHRFLLLTHLTYYGYCFNPVSFYYIVDRSTNVIESIVGEVSNTPWNEMYCYLLHPASKDAVTVSRKGSPGPINYVFPKTFHVSPFMEMDYVYNWTFHDLEPERPIRVTNDLRRSSDQTLQFHASMLLHRQPLHPFCIAWNMSMYPMHCVLVQLWIHYEAFWLFLKGVPYQPHPEGSETTASRLIGTLMVPFFSAKEKLDNWRGKKAIF